MSLKEVKQYLTQFKNEKRLGPDGWTVELFLHFFEIMGEEMLSMVELSRTKGFVLGALNSTFITLISKSSKPISFEDFSRYLFVTFFTSLYKKL